MTIRQRFGFVIMWVLSLVGVAALAQAQRSPVPPPVTPVPQMDLTGSDVGFRVKGVHDKTPVGTLLVRINGQWVEAEIGSVPTVRSVESH